MSNISISADTLIAKRQTFRKQFQVPGGKKQKLSHLDNLLVLSLGYPHGYGNFTALTKSSTYLFNLQNVNVIDLVKYEVDHISCACGLENYLYFYHYLGLSESDLYSFSKDYLIYKLIFSAWDELTNPVWYQQQIQILEMLSEENADLEAIQANLFNFSPLFGLIYVPIYSTKSLKEIGLAKKIALIEELIEKAKNEYGHNYSSKNEAEQIFIEHLPDIRTAMDFDQISTILLDALLTVFFQYHLFDVRAYSTYLFSCNEEYCIPNFANKESCTLYLGEESLVLKDGSHYSSVLLTPNESVEVDAMFANHGKSTATEEFLAKLWVKNTKQGSGTAWSQQNDWKDAIRRAKKLLTQQEYLASYGYPGRAL